MVRSSRGDNVSVGSAARRSTRFPSQSGMSGVSALTGIMPYRMQELARPQVLPLKPLFFEVPGGNPEGLFVGRQWLFREVSEHLSSDLPTNRGVIIAGGAGSGKTTIVLQLVENSCFGRGSADGNHYPGKQTNKYLMVVIVYMFMFLQTSVPLR